ncbi:hypothetical protein AXG93_4492s1470 [Marchantia polymorpha subsp. ruderalis]|uniref:Exoribonuclease phosphorolytic domain-containing protein n=1 Tax=Marchantia polymorpha subsp. ruderalis TaxID=1480154 RepID=A0A176W7X6_MARPO|nr:hypothetical protein AXG93_4492s1470 [Marchantia polymorpha subsp. ruderalis]
MANSLKPDEARIDGRTANQLRPLLCTRGLLERAHGSARWQQENTIVMAAVYGPKNVSGKRENSERATVEIIWKMKSGLPGNAEKEAEVIIRRTLDYIVLSAMHPNTGISIIFQAPALCAVAVSCAVTTNGVVVLDPTKAEEKNFRAHVCLVFPNRPKSTVAGLPPPVAGEPAEHGIITCLTRGAMSVNMSSILDKKLLF